MTNKILKIKDLLSLGRLSLKESGIESFIIDSELILANLLNKSRVDLLMNGELEVESSIFDKYKELICRRERNEPITQIIGYREFWKEKFYVNKSTLIPRPETECLIEEVLKIYKDKKNLLFGDFGAGTGCIGLSIMQELEDSKCFLIEKSKNAMKMIFKNANNLNLNSRAVFQNMSWNNFKLSHRKKFDFIVSNPPYISRCEKSNLMRDVVYFEPSSALFANDDGLKAYHEVISISKKYLKTNGYLFFEIDKNFKRIKVPYFLKIHKVVKDLHGLERVMILKKII